MEKSIRNSLLHSHYRAGGIWDFHLTWSQTSEREETAPLTYLEFPQFPQRNRSRVFHMSLPLIPPGTSGQLCKMTNLYYPASIVDPVNKDYGKRTSVAQSMLSIGHDDH